MYDNDGVPEQFRVLCFCRENNLHMHKFAFRILIYRAQSPCTSATTNAQQNRQNNDKLAKYNGTINNIDKDNDDDDEINGPVIFKHLLATARFVRIWFCNIFFLPTKTRKNIIKNWKENRRTLANNEQTKKNKAKAEIAGYTILEMANPHG